LLGLVLVLVLIVVVDFGVVVRTAPILLLLPGRRTLARSFTGILPVPHRV
jgi:hypothetical protein